MLQLINNTLLFAFPNVHPDCKVGVEFIRTFRIPDDGKTYPLPPNCGRFPLKLVDEYQGRVHPDWVKRGGIFLPMYQAEALWINFKPHRVTRRRAEYPFALKISAGKRSAVTGKKWAAVLKEGDYVIVPSQPWLDGFVVSEGKIKQFIAAPLGSGVTVEGQLTGEEKFGGIQIEVFPMKYEEFDKRFPKIKERKGILRSHSRSLGEDDGFVATMDCAIPASADDGAQTMDWMGAEQETQTKGGLICNCAIPERAAGPAAAGGVIKPCGISKGMGMAAGGSMRQEVYDDKFGFDVWDREAAPASERRVFVHLANSQLWRAITDESPPSTPVTAEQAQRYGYPWFDFYNDDYDVSLIGASKKMKKVKSMGELKPEMLPENQSVKVPKCKVVKVNPGQVRNGSW